MSDCTLIALGAVTGVVLAYLFDIVWGIRWYILGYIFGNFFNVFEEFIVANGEWIQRFVKVK